MSAPLLISQEISVPSRVLIAPANLPISHEIIRQLNRLTGFEILSVKDPGHIDILIQFVSSSYKDQNLSADKIITVDLRSLSGPITESAAQIISKFVYGYSPLSDLLPEPATVTVEKKPVKVRLTPVRNVSDKTAIAKKPIVYALFYLFLAPFTPWILFLFQLIILAGFSYCAVKTFSPMCAKPAAKLVDFISYQSPAVFGSRELFDKFGLPVDVTAHALQDFSDVTQNLSQLNTTTADLFSGFFKKGIDRSSLDSLPFRINSANDSLAYFQSDLKELYQSSSKPAPVILQLAEKIITLRSSLTHLQTLLPDLPVLLGYEKKITYLVLLQDHTEIRPTGGLLDSFLLATVENGQLLDVQGYTTSFSDSQLHGIVEPPLLYKQITGASQWYLHDSNWDPDFPLSAQRAAWFINKEYSRQPDAVISVNSTLLTYLLPHQNYLSNYLSQVKPSGSGSISYLLKTVQDYISEIPAFTLQEQQQTSQVIFSQLSTGQIALSPQSFLAPSLSVLGWNGGLANPPCSGSACFADYFYAVDTNLGGNKSDVSINRHQEISLKFSPAVISASYRLTYQNSPLTSGWPAGNHKNFLRLYLPSQITVDQLLVNGQPVQNTQYSLYFDHGFTVLGVLVETPPQKTSLIELLAHQQLPQTSFRYQLVMPHQPGLLSLPVDISFSYPSDWQVTSYQTPSVASAGSLRYNTSSSAPQVINLDFTLNK